MISEYHFKMCHLNWFTSPTMHVNLIHSLSFLNKFTWMFIQTVFFDAVTELSWWWYWCSPPLGFRVDLLQFHQTQKHLRKFKANKQLLPQRQKILQKWLILNIPLYVYTTIMFFTVYVPMGLRIHISILCIFIVYTFLNLKQVKIIQILLWSCWPVTTYWTLCTQDRRQNIWPICLGLVSSKNLAILKTI